MIVKMWENGNYKSTNMNFHENQSIGHPGLGKSRFRVVHVENNKLYIIQE